MKKNHFIRIFATYILIMFAGCILIGLLSIQLFKYYLINSAETTMYSNINLIESNLSELYLIQDTVDYNNLAKKYSEATRSSVSFINEKGDIIGERIKGFYEERNIINSEEIVNAKQKGYGNSFNYDDNLNVYILKVTKQVNNSFNGYIHLTTPLTEVSEVNQGIVVYSLIGVIFVLCTSFILKFFFEKDIINPLQEIIDTSINNRNKELRERLKIVSDDIIGVMANEYNSMLDVAENKIIYLKNRNEEMEYTLSSMDIGIIIVDAEGRILFTNTSSLKMFNFDSGENDILDKKVIELVKDAKLNNLIKDCIENGNSSEFETEVNDEKVAKILIRRINNNSKASTSGCLVIIYDITHVKKLEQMSSDFVSNVSHEIKTPLTSIKGFVETLKEGAIEDDGVAYKFLDIIDLECERLYSLINDILQLSEIQNIEQDVNRNFNYIQDIIKEVVTVLNSQAANKNIKLTSNTDENIPLILINKNRIKQMIINIVGNAIKYTNNGGEIKVSAFRQDENVVISVKDNGIGIPKESVERLFERFFRVDKGRSRQMGGTGLGLSIVKQIVDLYNGIIDIKSEVGKGTEFIVKIPINIG